MPNYCFYCGNDGGVFNCQSDTERDACGYYNSPKTPDHLEICDFCSANSVDGNVCKTLNDAIYCACYETGETQLSISNWGRRTFPGVSLYSAVVRMLQEAHELVSLFWIDRDHALQHPKLPDKAKIAGEIADVYNTLVGVADRAGVDIQEAVNTKMEINRKRNWKIGKDGYGQNVVE